MNRIFIIGGANIDINASSNKPLIVRDSNPSNISLSFGGVGRNIAVNLALLKENVYFCTVLSNDAFGKTIKDDLLSNNINLDFSESIDNYNTSMYIAILDENKDMYLGLSDMDILNQIKKSTIDKLIEEIDTEDILIFDTNLDQELMKYICEIAKGSVFMDPISVRKAYKARPLLNYIDIFKPNIYESESLSGIYIKDSKSANKSIDYYLENGTKEIIISLASDGVVAANKDERYWLHHDKINIVNATGGGDAFLASYIKSRNKNKNLLENVKYAIGGAVSTIKCLDAVNPKISDKVIEKEIRELNIVVEDLSTTR